jgi:aryl-alcohol dehydrogenase-like predicted oxidoreductase
MDHHGRVAESLEDSLKNLGTYIDLVWYAEHS